MLPPLKGRAACEFLATAGLACAVIGSGIAAQRLSPQDTGLQLLENSIATTLALVALLLAFGAHMNPVVTAVEWVRGRMTGRDALAFVAAQMAGGIVGAVVANAMFKRPLIEASTQVRTGLPLWVGEVVATFGLLVTIHGTLRSNRSALPLAVGCYIGAAYWFTSSTSFANPAVTLARAFSDSFAGIAPASVPGFVLSQVVGAALSCPTLALLLAQPAGTEASR